MADADVKPETSDQINLLVKNQQNEEVHFKVKLSTKIMKIAKAYCDKKGLQVDSVRFLFDGAPLAKDRTPADYDMEDGDTIDVMIEQLGGC